MDTNASYENLHFIDKPLSRDSDKEVVSENVLGNDEFQTIVNNADNKRESELNEKLFVIEGVSTNSGVNG